MPKEDTDTQYHVSLSWPMRVKMGGTTVPVCAFDAVIAIDVSIPGQIMAAWIAFRTDCMYSTTDMGRRNIKVLVLVPIANIAGMVPQPFETRGR
jgi:hypothetical protein